jgi:hypothetical protein
MSLKQKFKKIFSNTIKLSLDLMLLRPMSREQMSLEQVSLDKLSL